MDFSLDQALQRHREAWPALKALLERALEDRDSDLVKLAKLCAETEKLIQEGERKSWEAAAPVASAPSPRPSLDLAGLSPHDLAILARAAFRGE